MANQYTKLFISNQEIDLKDSERLPLNITKRVNSIEGSVQGDYSRASIEVYATKNNVAILGNTREFKPFRIEVDGQPDLNGIARVRKGKTWTQAYSSIKDTYEINLISNNSSPFTLLGETMLSDLTDLVVEYNTIPVLSGFIANPATRDHVFTFIKLKEWANSTGSGATLLYQPSLFETTAGLYLKPLVIAAFNSVGYTVESEFLDTIEGQQTFMPTFFPEKMPQGYNDKYMNTEVSMSAPTTFGAIGAAQYQFDVIDVAAPSNPNAYDNLVNFIYTAPNTGYYSTDISFVFANTPPPPPYFFIIQCRKNLTVISPPIGFGFDDTVVPYPIAGTILKAEAVVFLNAGETLDWTFSTNGGVTVNSARCNFKGEATIVQGSEIDFKYLLEGLGFLDMLFGWKTIKNLSFETDENRKIVTIEPKDGYISTDREASAATWKEGFYTSEIKDYSETIDRSKVGKFEFPEFEYSFNYTYPSDSDETADWVEGTNDFKIYEARYPMSSGANTKSPRKIEVPFFHKTIHVSDHLTQFPNTNAIPQYLLVYPQNYVLDPTATEARNDIKPRIAFFAGQRFGLDFDETDGLMEFFEFPGVDQKVPLSFMVNHNDPSGLDVNLGFNSLVLNGQNSVGQLHRSYLNEVVRNDIGETRENYNRFNSIDNLNFSFRVKAFIDNQRYIVQELQAFNPLIDDPTNFLFFLDVVPSQVEVDKIQNSPVSDIVTLLST